MKFSFSHELWKLFKNFYILTEGINISIFETPVLFSQYNTSMNYGNCISYPQVEMNNIFCKMIRRNASVDKRCLLCDAYHAELCRESRKPLVYRCHLGLLEAQIPICCAGDNAAILFFGMVCDRPIESAETAFEEIWRSLCTIDLLFFRSREEDPSAYAFYLSHYRALHRMTLEQFEAWSRFLYTLSADWQERGFVRILDASPADTVRSYIMAHIEGPIHAEDVCAALHFSRATLYRAIKNETGLGFNSYVNRLKLEYARRLLEQNSAIGEVATRLGYENVSYFSRLFHTRYGVSPSEYVRDIIKYSTLSQEIYTTIE